MKESGDTKTEIKREREREVHIYLHNSLLQRVTVGGSYILLLQILQHKILAYSCLYKKRNTLGNLVYEIH